MATFVQQVILHKSALLQRIMDCVRVGYTSYCTGFVEAHSAARFARRFAIYYRTDLDRNRRARLKKAGQGCAVLLLHDLDGAGRLFWILLLSPGEHPARKLEPSLRNALEERITVGQYELLRMTRPGTRRPAYTWQLTKSAKVALRAYVVNTVRRGSARDVSSLIESLYRSLGFRGVRIQVGKCCALLRAEWRRTHQGPAPAFPKKLNYIARIKMPSVSLGLWIAAQQRKSSDVTPSS